MAKRTLLNPAKKIIDLFGGTGKVVEITGSSRARVYLWMRDAEAGGTGGIIPIQHARKLYEAAKELGVDVQAEDFFAEVEPAQ